MTFEEWWVANGFGFKDDEIEAKNMFRIAWDAAYAAAKAEQRNEPQDQLAKLFRDHARKIKKINDSIDNKLDFNDPIEP